MGYWRANNNASDSSLNERDGNPSELYIERQLGRLFELLKRRKNYDINFDLIQKAPWRRAML